MKHSIKKYLGSASIIVLLAAMTGCGDGDKSREQAAQIMAQRFYDAAMSLDTKSLLDLVAYPFRFDDTVLEDQAGLTKMLEKKWREVNSRVQSARLIKSISYEDFVGGETFMGISLSKDDAEKQARRINFHAGCLLVRCYHADKETRREDGRGYYLVMKSDEGKGGLKIITYYD